MANLRTFTLDHNEQKDRWDLKNDTTNRVVKTFETKNDATAGGAIKQVLGSEGGSVKIQKENGQYQEERTYPRSKDPRSSKG